MQPNQKIFIRQLVSLLLFQFLLGAILSFIIPKHLSAMAGILSLSIGSQLYGYWEETRHPQLLAPNAKKLALTIALIYSISALVFSLYKMDINPRSVTIGVFVSVFFALLTYLIVWYFLEPKSKRIKLNKNKNLQN